MQLKWYLLERNGLLSGQTERGEMMGSWQAINDGFVSSSAAWVVSLNPELCF